MSVALRQLFALFDVDTGAAVTKLQQLNDKTTSVKDALGALGGTLLGAFSLHGIKSFIEEQIALGGALGDTADRLGMASAEVQKFQYAASQIAGVAKEDAARALGVLNKNVGEAIGGSAEAAKQFTELGVAIKENDGSVRGLSTVMPEIADAFAKMGSDQERAAAATRMFGKAGAALMPMLRGGSAAVAELNDQFDALGLGIDDDFLAKADAAGDALETMKLGFRALKTRIAGEFLPSITAASKKVSEWVSWGSKMAKETHIVKEAVWGLGAVSAVAAAKTAASWGKVLGLFPKGGNLVANLFSLGYIGVVIGLLLLVAGAIEDIVVWCQGGESVIGGFIEEMLGAEKAKEIVDSLNNAWAQMQPALDELKPLIADIGAGFAKALPYAIALVLDLVKGVMAAVLSVKTLGSALSSYINGKSGDQIGAEFMQNSDAIFGPKGVLKGSTFVDLLTAKPTVPASAAGVYGPPPPPGSANVNTNTTINVNGAGDPSEVARRVTGAQAGVNQQALNDAANALASGSE